MLTAIHDSKSRITHMDVVQGITPKLSSDRTNGKDLINPCQTEQNSTRTQGVLINGKLSVYTTYNEYNNTNTVTQVQIHDRKNNLPYYTLPLSTLNQHYSKEMEAPKILSRSNNIRANPYDSSRKTFINGKQFFPFLKPKDGFKRLNLLESNNYNPNGIIIASDIVYPGKNDIKKCYTSFNTTHDAFIWCRGLQFDALICYEIMKDDLQKSHFDIDIDLDDNDPNQVKYSLVQLGTDSRDSTIAVIKSLMKEMNLPDYSLLVYSSHRVDKQSYHIIIDGYCHLNAKEALALYNLVKVRLPKHLQRYIDSAVYGRNKAFRLLGHHKLGKDNTKVLHPSTTWVPFDHGDDENVKAYRLFEASLVTFCSGCKPFPSLMSDSNNKTTRFSYVDINPYYDPVINIFNQLHYSQDFTVRDCSASIISLDSNHTIVCPVHNRRHESEHAFLSLSDSGHVYFNCRRGGSVYVGTINGVTSSVTDSDVEESVDTNDCNPMGHLCLNHLCDYNDCLNTKAITIGTTNNIVFSEKLPQRVQAIPIIGGKVIVNNQSAQVHNGLTPTCTKNSQNTPYITNKQHVPVQVVVKQGQTCQPSVTTTIVSFLQGNIKYISGNEYPLQEIFDSYNEYRGNLGVKYNLQGSNTLTAALTKDGNIITRKRINGKQQQVVLLKRTEPEVITTTNPTQIQPITMNVMMKAKKAEKVSEEVGVDLREKWNKIEYEKLFGTTVDMNERLPKITQMVGNYDRYVLNIKAPMASGKTEIIIEELMRMGIVRKKGGDEKYHTKSFLIVSARIPLTRETNRRSE